MIFNCGRKNRKTREDKFCFALNSFSPFLSLSLSFKRFSLLLKSIPEGKNVVRVTKIAHGWKLYYKDRRSLAVRRVSPVDQKFRRESFDRVFAREIYILNLPRAREVLWSDRNQRMRQTRPNFSKLRRPASPTFPPVNVAAAMEERG